MQIKVKVKLIDGTEFEAERGVDEVWRPHKVLQDWSRAKLGGVIYKTIWVPVNAMLYEVQILKDSQ